MNCLMVFACVSKFRFVEQFVKFASHPWLPLWGSCPNGTERAVGSILLVQITKEPFLSIIFSSNDLFTEYYAKTRVHTALSGAVAPALPEGEPRASAKP